MERSKQSTVKVLSRTFSTNLSRAAQHRYPISTLALVASFAFGGATHFFTNRAYAAGVGTRINDRSQIPPSALKEIQDLWNASKKPDSPTMDYDSFLNAVAPNTVEEERKKHDLKFRTLFTLADKDKDGVLTFEEFLDFEILMTGPDADYRIAFGLFDEDRNGLLTLKEFHQVLRTTRLLPPNLNFDMNCEWIKSFFGPDGQNRLNYEDFTQMLKGLEGELLRQAFRAAAFDKPDQTYITNEQFEAIMRDNLSARVLAELPPLITENLSKLVGEKVSYAEFIAFYNVIRNFHQVKESIVGASTHKRHPKITKKEFLRIARRIKMLEFTPLEAEVVFRIFDLDKDGLISIHDYNHVLPELPNPDTKSQSFTEVLVDSLVHFVLGSVAGAIGATFVYPIDLVKTRMQNQRDVVGSQRLYNNSLDCFKKVVTQEGVRGLYRGLGPQLIGVAPEKAIKLTVNDLLRSLFGKSMGYNYLPLEILAGMGAGASQVIFTNPLEIVKIRLQTQGEAAKFGVKPKSALTIVRELGFQGLYKGAAACLLRDIPFSGIYFPVYAKTKEWLTDPNVGTPDAKSLLLAGTLAGAPAASLTTPADVIKTRLQVEARAGQQTYKNIPHCAVTIWKTEGFHAFWKGAGARVFRSSPQFGVTLLSYELLQRWLAPDLSSPRPPTNVPVDTVDYNRLFRGGVGRSLRRADQRWGLFGAYKNKDIKP